jgi:hypothetical protein
LHSALEANDIDGNTMSFDRLKGKTVYIMNIAYGHKHTERFIRDISAMGDKYIQKGLQILLFPSDQFGDTATNEQYKVLLHKRQQGIRMMAKVRKPAYSIGRGGRAKLTLCVPVCIDSCPRPRAASRFCTAQYRHCWL